MGRTKDKNQDLLKKRKAIVVAEGRRLPKKQMRTNAPDPGFLEYLEDFRKKYKILFPRNDESTAHIVDLAAIEWRSMPASEKEPFVLIAEDIKEQTEFKEVAFSYYRNGHEFEEPKGNDEAGSTGGSN